MRTRIFRLALWAAIAAAAQANAAVPGPPVAGSNAQIGTDTGVASVALDWESGSGDLFAVLRYDLGELMGDWRVYRSADGGRSWSQTGWWQGDADAVDAAVVDSWLYVGYASGTQARIRRAASATGQLDVVYDYKVVFDATPATVEEVALVANSDDNDNVLWLFALTSDGQVRAFSCGADTCFSMVEDPTGPGVTDAQRGLAGAWNIGYNSGFAPSGKFVLFSYVTTSGEIHVYRRSTGEPAWLASNIELTNTGSYTTSLAAYRDHVAVVYEYAAPGGPDARAAISHDGGYGWSVGTFADADYTGGPYFTPMVSARSRSGLGAAVQWDRPTGDDSYWLGQVPDFAPPFQDWTIVNDHDFNYGPLTITSDLQWMGSGWGLAYSCALSKAWFTWSPLIRYSGFEVGGFDEWSAAVGEPPS
jgi:hypothetical protein